MIAGNRLGGESCGAARRGTALLAGLLRCRRCGRRLRVRYKGPGNDIVRYTCPRAVLDNKESRCIAFSGAQVDAMIAGQLLCVVQPVAIEAAMMASEQHTRERSEVLEALARDLQAARYRAGRAERQYEASDPENRLVTQELERRWNVALQQVRDIETRIEAETGSRHDTPACTLEDFKDLAADLEMLWNDPNTDQRVKKRLLRALIREVVVDIDGSTSEIVVLIHWKGGVHTPLRIKRRRPGERSAQMPDSVIDAVRSLSRILHDEKIAAFLNRAKLRTVHGNFWTRALVTSLRFNHGIDCYDPERRVAEGWMNLSQAARLVGVTNRTLRLAIERGEVCAERPIFCGPWIINKRALQSESALAFVARTRVGRTYPTIPSAEQAQLDLSVT
jgi:hypothetical protein